MRGGDRVQIDAAEPADRAFVARLSAEVFSRFGPYDIYLPEMMQERGTRTLIAHRGSERIGFVMFSIAPDEPVEADVVAIATAPAWQGKGIGRRMLQRVETDLEASRPRAVAVRLTVAEDNLGARCLFESAGYRTVSGHSGSYPRGQKSIEMRKPLGGLRGV